MRPIDAEALKAKWYEINDIDENDRGARFVGYTEIPRLIDQALTVSAEAVQGWIPCSERLPETKFRYRDVDVDGTVVECFESDPVLAQARWEGREEEGLVTAVYDVWTLSNGTLDTAWETLVDFTTLTVTAWMPLPEPYKDKERKDGNDKTETRP